MSLFLSLQGPFVTTLWPLYLCVNFKIDLQRHEPSTPAQIHNVQTNNNK